MLTFPAAPRPAPGPSYSSQGPQIISKLLDCPLRAPGSVTVSPAFQSLATASFTSANGSDAPLAQDFGSFCFLFSNQPPCLCSASSRSGHPRVGWLIPPVSLLVSASCPRPGGEWRERECGFQAAQGLRLSPESHCLGLNPCHSAYGLIPL